MSKTMPADFARFTTPVLIVVLVGAAGAAAFFSGVRFQSLQNDFIVQAYAQDPVRFDTQNSNRKTNTGEVVAKEGNTITIKNQNGFTEKIVITHDTDVTGTSNATTRDLTIGNEVMIYSTEENGGISTEMIEINPLTRKWIFE